jgi:hypothetical protein
MRTARHRPDDALAAAGAVEQDPPCPAMTGDLVDALGRRPE